MAGRRQLRRRLGDEAAARMGARTSEGRPGDDAGGPSSCFYIVYCQDKGHKPGVEGESKKAGRGVKSTRHGGTKNRRRRTKGATPAGAGANSERRGVTGTGINTGTRNAREKWGHTIDTVKARSGEQKDRSGGGGDSGEGQDTKRKRTGRKDHGSRGRGRASGNQAKDERL